MCERANRKLDVKQEIRVGSPCEEKSSDARTRDGLISMSVEVSVMEMEQRDQLGAANSYQRKGVIPYRRSVKEQQKAFAISQEEVLLAWKRVKQKGGKGGSDGVSIKYFEKKLKDNLYKIWNRMSSGSYHPQAVMRVEIPKGGGEKRELGIPTILDRVAQQVVRARLERVLEPIFHADSYGYRKNQSAITAVKNCRSRCWSYDWVLDVDIRKFFDTIDHDLMMKAVNHHCQEAWMVKYIERWLKNPVKHVDGRIENPEKGTPQGGVISPLLANLYLHYAFDLWMKREYQEVKFERYADDAVIHCKTEEQAEEIRDALAKRLEECGLALHPKKTKVVYCKKARSERTNYPEQRFTFLGYTFQPRDAVARKDPTKKFLSYLPAVSTNSLKRFRTSIREEGHFRMTHLSVEDLAEGLNSKIRGFYNYFAHFYKSKLGELDYWLDGAIVRWWRKKAKCNTRKAIRFLERLKIQTPKLFAHWNFRLP